MADEETPDSDESAVLSPDELDITDDQRVVEIDDGRYVISSDDSPPRESSAAAAEDIGDEGEEAVELTEAVVHEWLEEHVEGSNSRYGFDVTAKFEDGVRRRELFSNDVVTTFESLMVWYAQHIGDDTPVEEALGILLTESNIPIRYPAETIRDLVAAKDLEADDRIRDLLDAVDASDGFHLPSAGSQRRE